MEASSATAQPDTDAPNADRVSAGDEEQHCRNCGARLVGPYCAECGQEARQRAVPFWQFGREALGEVFSFDTRFLRAFRPLLFRPGFLAKEYFAGRRKRYVPPLRLYLFVSFIYFLVFGLPGVRPYVSEGPAPEQEQTEQAPADASQGSAATSKEEETEDRDPIAYGTGRTLAHNFSVFLFAFVPLIALGLTLLYVRSGWLYVHHLIFVLHLQAFFFVAELPRMVLDAVLPAATYEAFEGPLFWTTLAIVGVYALFAVRRFYAQRWWKTVVKTLLLAVLYGVAFAALVVVIATYYALVEGFYGPGPFGG